MINILQDWRTYRKLVSFFSPGITHQYDVSGAYIYDLLLFFLCVIFTWNFLQFRRVTSNITTWRILNDFYSFLTTQSKGLDVIIVACVRFGKNTKTLENWYLRNIISHYDVTIIVKYLLSTSSRYYKHEAFHCLKI